jgi:NAD(P)-dependent dehydrogenase (short-subunit alcohol dehydrogenase family)
MGTLDGRVAIVTGAGRGIGRAHALLLAAEGASVVVNDIGAEWDGVGADERPAQKVVDEISAAGGQAVANHDDVSSWKGAADLVQAAVDTYGKLDVLVNNAGFLRDRMSFSTEEEDWDEVVRVHLKGHFAPCRHAAAHWRDRSKGGQEVSGRIVNTTSEAGLFGNVGQANYSAAKAGIVGMTLVLARELVKYGVTVNAIAPRARTRMTTRTFEGFGRAEEGKFDQWDPHNVAPTIAWLAGPDAGHVTGQVFVVWADRLYLMEGWHRVATLAKGDDRWTPAELAARSRELFGERSPGLPPTGFGL